MRQPGRRRWTDHKKAGWPTVVGACCCPGSGIGRELENAIEHAFILCRTGYIGLSHLPEQIRPRTDVIPTVDRQGLTLRDVEKAAIRRALDRNHWKRLATARELGIDKNTLRRKIQRYGIDGG